VRMRKKNGISVGEEDGKNGSKKATGKINKTTKGGVLNKKRKPRESRKRGGRRTR